MREAKIFIADVVSGRADLNLDIITFENESASLEIFALENHQINAIEKCCVT